MTDLIADGIHKSISNSDYHADLAIGSTSLKTLHAGTPALYNYKRSQPPEQKAEWDLGTAVHLGALQPIEFERLVVPEPQCDRRTRNGKAIWAKFQGSAAGKLILTAEQYDTAIAMIAALRTHPQVMEALRGAWIEHSVFHTESGVRLKARPDAWKSSLLIDLKTCRNASPRGFENDATQLNYHIQAAHYLDICRHYGPAESFLLICVESSPPYQVALYLADELFLEIGRHDRKKALDLLIECEQKQEWPGYSPDVQMLSVPGWKAREYESQFV